MEKIKQGAKTECRKKMMRYINLREEVAEELEPIDFEIPLFRLQPPKTPKSSVSYKESHARSRGWNIFIKVPGFAIGADLSLRLQVEGEVETSEDKSKIIILPVCIRRRRVNIYFGNVCIARNKIVAEASNKKTGQIMSRIIRSCTDYIPPSSRAVLIADYNLIDDTTSINSKFSIGWGKDVNNQAGFTIPIPGITPGIEVLIRMEHEVKLGFDLEPRHDYKLYSIQNGIGITWKVSKELSLAG